MCKGWECALELGTSTFGAPVTPFRAATGFPSHHRANLSILNLPSSTELSTAGRPSPRIFPPLLASPTSSSPPAEYISSTFTTKPLLCTPLSMLLNPFPFLFLFYPQSCNSRLSLLASPTPSLPPRQTQIQHSLYPILLPILIF